MSDTVLTDGEIDSLDPKWLTDRKYARAVEAAVLAKLRTRDGLQDASRYAASMGGPNRFGRRVRDGHQTRPTDNLTYGCIAPGVPVVTEREARQRERTAWDESALYLWRLLGGVTLGTRHDYPEKERDRRYPLPTTTKPRTVTLSDGTMVTKCENSGLWNVRAASGAGVSNAYVFGYALTPADARILADLVEHPTEEVPDA